MTSKTDAKSILRDALDRLSSLCLEWPDVALASTFGNPTFQAGKKSFAVLETYKGAPVVCFKATLEDQELLVARPGFFKAPYVGRHGWTCLRLDAGVAWEEIEELVAASHRLASGSG